MAPNKMKNTHFDILFSFIFIFIFLITTNLFGQAGNLDPNFGQLGRVKTAIGSGSDVANAIAIQSDGKMVVAGKSDNGSNNDFALVRYNTNGSLDTSFSNDGKLTTAFANNTDCYLNSVAIQPDGKIVVAGYFRNNGNSVYYFALLRYTANGAADNSFGVGGKTSTLLGNGNDAKGHSLAIQSNGKIIVAGVSYNNVDYDIAIARYDTNGVLDNSFGTAGKVITSVTTASDDDANSVVVQPDDKIIVGGLSYFSSVNHFLLLRYSANGALDTSFNSTGIVTTIITANSNTGHAVALQTDGKIVLAGGEATGTNYNFALLRFNTDGALDTSFNTNGYVTTDFSNGFDEASSVAVQTDGKIIIAGYTYGVNNLFAVARYQSNGIIDSTFGTNGKVITSFNANGGDFINGIALQTDTKIVVSGYTDNGTDNDFALARYLSGLNLGFIDLNVNPESLFIYPNPLRDEAVIDYNLIRDELLTASLYDFNGKFVKTIFKNAMRSMGKHEEKLIFGNGLTPGYYMLKLSNKYDEISIKIAVQ